MISNFSGIVFSIDLVWLAEKLKNVFTPFLGQVKVNVKVKVKVGVQMVQRVGTAFKKRKLITVDLVI